ncbi:hypothetical protein AC579_8115 [Lecanosticta acicola]|uniref:Conserved oligomeric Golgi complex subunit 2 n=1 Tax=Lecanosticta acicola TaxID=111012 RepID=A0AAI8YZ30_9PEZI|nr:hypothetical protein AC579_8115 [Lecanosticta acicola]
MSKFHLPSSTTSANSTPANPSTYTTDDEDDDIDTLPYPGELPRNDFLAPDFDPQTYLSTLRNRHQTLEDLRSDLRQRSQLLNKELLDLVNGNYEEFLSLGGDLKGGEERVEGVRLGLLGFQREVEAIKKGVRERADEVGQLVKERKTVRRDVALGRSLLEVNEKLTELEEDLGIKTGAEYDDLDDEDEEEDANVGGVRVKKLQQHAQQYVLITRLMGRIGASHPFLVAQGSRLEEISRIILLDLAAGLRQAEKSAPEAIVSVLKVYGDIGAEEEGVKVLKGS